ncbi:hypothetical protein J2S22_002610 [Rhodoplanes tepidamans]|nr:hypothetical protein [Rhodoplanes tepidamans]
MESVGHMCMRRRWPGAVRSLAAVATGRPAVRIEGPAAAQSHRGPVSGPHGRGAPDLVANSDSVADSDLVSDPAPAADRRGRRRRLDRIVAARDAVASRDPASPGRRRAEIDRAIHDLVPWNWTAMRARR